MVQVKDLTELSLADLWQEVKEDEGVWWGDLKQETVHVVQRLLETAVAEELLEHLRAGRHRRTELRRGYCNGYRYRNLLTELGVGGAVAGAAGPGGGRDTNQLTVVLPTPTKGRSITWWGKPFRLE